jgi:hypothetical protein
MFGDKHFLLGCGAYCTDVPNFEKKLGDLVHSRQTTWQDDGRICE